MTDNEVLNTILKEHIENTKRHISICLFGIDYESDYLDYNEKVKMKNKAQVEYLRLKKIYEPYTAKLLSVSEFPGETGFDAYSEEDKKTVWAILLCEKYYVVKADLFETIEELFKDHGFSKNNDGKVNPRLTTLYNSLMKRFSKTIFGEDSNIVFDGKTADSLEQELLVMDTAQRFCERVIVSNFAYDNAYDELFGGIDKYNELFDAANAEGNYEKQEDMNSKVVRYYKDQMAGYEENRIGEDIYGPEFMDQLTEAENAHKDYERFKDAETSINQQYKEKQPKYEGMSKEEALEQIADELYQTAYSEAKAKATQLKPLSDKYLAMVSKVYETGKKVNEIKNSWFKDFKLNMKAWKKSGVKPEKNSFWQELKNKRKIKKANKQLKISKQFRKASLNSFKNNKHINRLRELLGDDQFNSLTTLLDVASEINNPTLNDHVKKLIKQLETGPCPYIISSEEIEDLVGKIEVEKEKPISKDELGKTRKPKKVPDPNKRKHAINRKKITNAQMTRKQILELSCQGGFNINEENYRFFVFRGMTLFGETFINQFLNLSTDEEREKMINSIDKLWDEQYVKPLKEAHINSESYDQLVYVGTHVFGDSFVSMLINAKTADEKRKILQEMSQKWNSHKTVKERLVSDKSKKMTAFSAFAEDLLRLEHYEANMHR